MSNEKNTIGLDIGLGPTFENSLNDGFEIIDKSQMNPLEFRKKTVVSIRDSCHRPYSFYASIKTEGWKVPKRPLERYCYAYDFLKT